MDSGPGGSPSRFLISQESQSSTRSLQKREFKVNVRQRKKQFKLEVKQLEKDEESKEQEGEENAEFEGDSDESYFVFPKAGTGE